jgi:transposase
MIDMETKARIRHLFHAEHWKIGTIAAELRLHPKTIAAALETERFKNKTVRTSSVDQYAGFIRETLEKHPNLRATRILEMIRLRGYTNGIHPVRSFVAEHRPKHREAFLRLHTFPGEQAQVDWASFGTVTIGRAKRKLSCFVITLSYSRAIYLEFFFDQTIESFIRGHINAFEAWNGTPRVLLYDNLRSVILERRNDAAHFNPRFVQLQSHYHFQAKPCQIRAAHQKGGVERAIRYIRDSFFAARPFTTLSDFNRQALQWRDNIANARKCHEIDSRTVADVFAEEQHRLMPLPVNRFDADRIVPVKSNKTIYIRFDSNDYSIPPGAVGKQLIIAASESWVRILDGTHEIARHRRSYDRRQMILDPAHQDELLKIKQKAAGSVSGGRLAAAVPQSEAFLDAAFARGNSAAVQTARLVKLLDTYGQEELRIAIQEALSRNTPNASSVAFILSQRWKKARRKPLPHVDLSRRPDLESINVNTHNPEIYDDLAKHNS